MSLEHDQALYQNYQLAYQKHHKKEDLLASIILKAQMLGFYPEVELTASQEELDFLHDYLFSVMIWGNFELNLFSLTSPLFSSQPLSTIHRGVGPTGGFQASPRLFSFCP